jgi:hypothetical protein
LANEYLFCNRVPVAGKAMKLPHRLLIVVSLALAPISALQTYSAFRLEAQQTLATYAAAQRLLQLIEDEQVGTIEGIRQILVTIRQTRPIISQDWPGCQQFLNRLKKEYPPQLNIYVTDVKGIVECSSDPSAVSIDVSSQIHVKAALAGTEFFIGGQVPSKATHKSALPFSLPYHDPETGNVAGAVTVLLDVGWLEDKLSVKSLLPSSTLTMADRDGFIIAQAPRSSDAAGTRLPDRLMEMIGRDSVGIQKIVEADGVNRV